MDFRVTRIHVLTVNNTTGPFQRTEWSLQQLNLSSKISQSKSMYPLTFLHLDYPQLCPFNIMLYRTNLIFTWEYEVKTKKLRSSSQCYCYNLIQEPAQDVKEFTPFKVCSMYKKCRCTFPFFLTITSQQLSFCCVPSHRLG